MINKKVKIIVTLGPSTRTEDDLKKLKSQGVDFVRVNMSHSTTDDLRYFISLANKANIPFVVDTEGSQIRSGFLNAGQVYIEEGSSVRLHAKAVIGDEKNITITPLGFISQLQLGDIVRLDFDTLILRVSDLSTLSEGFITAVAVTAGYIGNNKGIVVDSAFPQNYSLPCLTEKDYQSIAIGLEENVGYIAASFMRSGAFVEEVRRATQGRMKIISKIECVDGLENLNDIIEKTDFILIDRGDLSKEIPLEKIPLTQKIILHRARQAGKGVFVATNLLETMVDKRKPTKAEIHDVVNTIMDGAYGLALSAETAIGKYPIDCVNMMNRLIRHVENTVAVEKFVQKEDNLVAKMNADNYLLDIETSSSLIEPHGGKLISRIVKNTHSAEELNKLPSIDLSDELQMDVEQIGIGTFSPIEGFMGEKDLDGVLNKMRLKSGVVWTIPIVLDVSFDKAHSLKIGDAIALRGGDEVVALLHLEEKYAFDKEKFAEKLYGTKSTDHPGVKNVYKMQPMLLAGKIDLLRRRQTETTQYELTPRQVRRLFDERGWTKVVGFHTRNVIHCSHEFLQLQALKQENCDGLFVHPIIGKKKIGDFNAKYIIKAYEIMMKKFYPKGKVIFATYATFSRYAGPREAIFTALCRKNFGCSHFIVGRDHTGVGNFYSPTASHGIFDQFPDLGIKPICFNNIFYSEKKQSHIHETDDNEHCENEKFHISGTQARKMLESGQYPPEWFMRPEISSMIIDAVKNNEDVFIK